MRVTLLMATVFLAGCPSSDLTRTQAAELIRKSKEFTAKLTELMLDRDAVEGAIRLGYWKRNARSNQLEFTDLKAPYLVHEGNSLTPKISLQNPVTRELVEVTGLVEAPAMPNHMQVEFTWRYKAAHPWPPELWEVTFGGLQSGKAFFAKSDDGWRLDRLEL